MFAAKQIPLLTEVVVVDEAMDVVVVNGSVVVVVMVVVVEVVEVDEDEDVVTGSRGLKALTLPYPKYLSQPGSPKSSALLMRRSFICSLVNSG